MHHRVDGALLQRLGPHVELRPVPLLTLEIVRDGREKQIRIEVQALNAMDGEDIDQRFAGARFEDLPLKQRSERLNGVVITELAADSRLARRGLRPGDVITGANRSNVRDLEEFEEIIDAVRGNIYLQVWRKGNEYVVRVD